RQRAARALLRAARHAHRDEREAGERPQCRAARGDGFARIRGNTAGGAARAPRQRAPARHARSAVRPAQPAAAGPGRPRAARAAFHHSSSCFQRSEFMKRILCAVLLCAPFAALAGVDEDVRALQNEWAQIKYARPAGEQEKAFAELTKNADAVRARYPGRAEPQIWYGIIAGSYAGARGGLGALGLAKDAKKAFEQALEIDPKALDGSAYTSLGSLYYQVPGWPIGFGDDA